MAKHRLEENDPGLQAIEWLGVLDYGNRDYTSMARTVALPAAIAVRMILEGKIKDAGVHIPIKKSIYKPVLTELADLGISMTESIETALLD